MWRKEHLGYLVDVLKVTSTSIHGSPVNRSSVSGPRAVAGHTETQSEVDARRCARHAKIATGAVPGETFTALFSVWLRPGHAMVGLATNDALGLFCRNKCVKML